MGLLTTLIEKHQRQKQDDWNKQMSVMTQLAGMENLKPEAKDAVFNNIASLAGDKLDMPKKTHGVLAQLLSGIHTHLSKGGQEGQGEQPQRPNMNALRSGPAAESKVVDGGGRLPSAPAYSPYYTDEQVQANKRNEGTKDAQAKYTEASREDQQGFAQQQDQSTQVASLKQKRLDKLHMDGTITDDEYGRASAEVQAGVKVPGMTASTMPKLGWAEVSDGKGGTKRIPGRVDPTTGGFTTLTGDEIAPEQIGKIGVGKDPSDTQRVAYKLQELTTAAKATHPDWSDAQVKTLVGQQIEAEESNKINQGSATLAKTRQSMAVTGAETGIGGAGGATFASTPAKLSGGAGTTTAAVKPAAAAAAKETGVPPVKPVAKGGSASPANIQHLIDTDDSVMAAKQWLAGGMRQGGSSGRGGVLVRQGMRKLMASVPGATENSLMAEAQGRTEANKSIALNYNRLEAYGVLTDQIDRMAGQMIDARKKLPNDPKVIAKWKNAVKQGYTDDPQLSEALTAANEFQKTYAKFLSGAGTSNAQTNVGAQEKTDSLIDASMGLEAMKGAVRQVRLAADNELGPIKDGIKRGQTALSKDWGQWNPDDLVPKGRGEGKERKVGETVNYNGKPHKILEIKPNGKYVLEN